MNEDSILLRRFVEDHAEEAFTELVQQYFPMVHATALRRVGGDAHLAQDVAQTVFIALARKASSLQGHVSLAGWLYIGTHRATAEIVRREQRRKQRETSAQFMNLASTSDDPPVDPTALRPLLDDALVELKSDDREAVVLRFFAQRSFAEIGDALRITEEAARKRVHRALDQRQATLSRRGITSTITALGSALTAAGITTAPATLGSEVAAAALAQIGLLPTAALTATLASTLLPVAAMAAVITGLWTIAPQQRANAAMADELDRLKRAPAAASGVQSEIDDLARALRLARTLPPSVLPTPPTSAPAALPAPVKYTRLTGAKDVSVDPEGRIHWEGDNVTLDEFLYRLATYQSSAAHIGSQLIVKGNGANFLQLSYVLDEARKAGITSLVVESDSDPNPYPRMPTSWF
jgi:RNA polymerase sigma factor (sigma-70 family)